MENKQIIVQKNNPTRLISNIVLLLSGRFVSLIGTQIYNFALGLYVLKTTGSPLSFGITLFFGVLPRVILGPFAGAISDRFDRKKMVVGMDYLSGLVVLALFAVSLIDGLRLFYIYAASFLLATANTFFDIPFTASIPNIVDDKSLMRITSLNQTISSIAAFTAPILAGSIFAYVDIKLFLFINGISFICSGISEMFIDFKFNVHILESENIKAQNSNSLNNILSQIKDGFCYLKSQEALFILFVFSIIINFFISIGNSVPTPFILNNVLKLSSTQYGFVQAASSIGMLLGSILLSIIPEKEKKYRYIVYGNLILSITILLIGLLVVPGLKIFNNAIYCVLYAIIKATMNIDVLFVNIPISVTMQRLVPDNMRGRVFGLQDTIVTAILPIGLLLSGILSNIIPVYIIPIASGGFLLMLSFLMIKNKSIKEL